MSSSSASEVATTATRWLDPVTGATHEPEMRRSVSDNGPTGSDGVPSDTTEDDWSRGSAEDPDEVPSPSSSPSPSPAEPPEHTGPITELDRKVSHAKCSTFTLKFQQQVLWEFRVSNYNSLVFPSSSILSYHRDLYRVISIIIFNEYLTNRINFFLGNKIPIFKH